MKKAIINIRILTTCIIAIPIFLVSCKDDSDLTAEREYELVWSDDFTGDSGTMIDPAKWTYDVGTGSNGWGNNELQRYTDKPENVSLDGKGNLVISALKQSAGVYTSARVKTEGLFTHKHGRIEARIKTPSGQGIWPAFWMLGENINQVGWPKCGEIDIMEQKGRTPFITYGSLHGPGYSAGNAVTNSYRLTEGNFDDAFFIYAVEWGEDYVDFFLNDNKYASISASEVSGDWVFNQSFYLLLNVAVGGSFVQSPNENTPFPSSMYVDYVKVYKQK